MRPERSSTTMRWCSDANVVATRCFHGWLLYVTDFFRQFTNGFSVQKPTFPFVLLCWLNGKINSTLDLWFWGWCILIDDWNCVGPASARNRNQLRCVLLSHLWIPNLAHTVKSISVGVDMLYVWWWWWLVNNNDRLGRTANQLALVGPQASWAGSKRNKAKWNYLYFSPIRSSAVVYHLMCDIFVSFQSANA